MVCKIVLALIVTVLLAIQPSTSSPIENEKLVALSERFDQLQTKVELLVVENEALKIRVDYLERKETEIEAKIWEQGEEIIQLKVKMDTKLESIQSSGPSRDELITELRFFKDNTMGSLYRKEVFSDDSSTRAVAPSSCRDLSLIGHVLDGLYLVLNANTKKVETVFCDFETSSSVVQDLVGTVDIKTKTVHFYVQRDWYFYTPNAVITFDVAPVNEGNAFNLSSGIFTIPVPGIYHFDLSALKDESASYLKISIQVNGVEVGLAWTTTGTAGHWNAVSLSASLRLAAGDRVNLYNDGRGVPYDNGEHCTHFSGWLVEEDLM